MVCPKCGNVLEENAKFCGRCGYRVGEPLEPNTIGTSLDEGERKVTEPKKPFRKRKIIIPLILVLLIGIAAAIGTAYFNRPVAVMNRAISADDFATAFEVYTTQLQDKPLEEDTIELLQEYADSVVNDYESGNLSYEDAMSEVDELTNFGLYDDTVATISETAVKTINRKNTLDKYITAGNEALESDDYLSAISSFEDALEVEPESEEAENGLTTAQDAYRDDVISQVDQAVSSREYSTAKDILNSALTNMPEDEILSEKLNGIDDLEVQNIVDDAYSAADGGDWAGAVEILEGAQENFSSNQQIAAAYEDIKNKMPITLENITTVSEKEVYRLDEVVKDRWGNIYDGAVRIDGSNDGYGLFALDKKYTRFTGTVFVMDLASAGKKLWFSVYLDEELVYYSDEITEESQPITFDIDVTGATSMRIVTGNEGTFSWGGLMFANTNFEKVAETDTASETNSAEETDTADTTDTSDTSE